MYHEELPHNTQSIRGKPEDPSYKVDGVPLTAMFDPWTGLHPSGKYTREAPGAAVKDGTAYIEMFGDPPWVYHGPCLAARRLADDLILVELEDAFYLGKERLAERLIAKIGVG